MGMAIASGKREGDLTDLVRSYQAGVWRYLRFLGAEDALADDLTQETFLTIWKRPFVDHTPAAAQMVRRASAWPTTRQRQPATN